MNSRREISPNTELEIHKTKIAQSQSQNKIINYLYISMFWEKKKENKYEKYEKYMCKFDIMINVLN